MTDRICDRLRTLRMEHEISQRQLAEELKVSNSTVSRAEKGESLPDTYTLMVYAEHFGVSTDWILFGKEYEG